MKIMKSLRYTYMIVGMIVFLASCTGNFAEINSNPQVMDNPKPEYVFTFAANVIPDGQSAWLYETFEQYLRWSQLVTTESYEPGSMDMNSRYNRLYDDVLPYLEETRSLIEKQPNKDEYMKMWAATYVLQAYAVLRVTDIVGSLPYSEAIKARSDEKYDPVYDNQSAVFSQLYDQLIEANRILQDGSLPATTPFELAQDIFYNFNWTKWSRLANAILLKLALRYESQDQARAIAIFRQVMADPVGVMTDNADGLIYVNPTGQPTGDIDYRSRRYASRHVVDFMKQTLDPRVYMYWETNGLVGAFRDTLELYNATLPDFIDISDPLIQYQGGVVRWTDPNSTWIKATFDVSDWSKYALISAINRKFFSPRMDGATDTFTDVLVSYAEVCFYIAEYIQKGYGAGIDTKGSAEDWYRKGVRASILKMYDVTVAAASFNFPANTDMNALIDAYLERSEIKFDGTNDLEKIMIQQYLNFFRSGPESFSFVRRTGYPKLTSTLLKSETLEGDIPRRLWTVEPISLNRAHWEDAYREQGFTLRDNTPGVLSRERLWWDKNHPAYGQGQ